MLTAVKFALMALMLTVAVVGVGAALCHVLQWVVPKRRNR